MMLTGPPEAASSLLAAMICKSEKSEKQGAGEQRVGPAVRPLCADPTRPAASTSQAAGWRQQPALRCEGNTCYQGHSIWVERELSWGALQAQPGSVNHKATTPPSAPRESARLGPLIFHDHLPTQSELTWRAKPAIRSLPSSPTTAAAPPLAANSDRMDVPQPTSSTVAPCIRLGFCVRAAW
jgi:hypothetical protein